MGSKSTKPAGWVMPPIAPFLDKPVEFGPYWLLSSLGKGAFGEALLAVRKRDVGEVKEPTCEQLYRCKAEKWVVKRFTQGEAKSEAKMPSPAERSAQERRAADRVRTELLKAKAESKNVLANDCDRRPGEQVRLSCV
jgi:hypothetical protein